MTEPPNKKRKAGRPRSDLTDKLVEPVAAEQSGAKQQHRCRFCHHTFPQRTCGRIKAHAANVCLVIPHSLKSEAQEELAHAAPSEKAQNVGPGAWQDEVQGKSGVPARHCATCTCGIMEHTPTTPMMEGQRKMQSLLEYALVMWIAVTGVPMSILDNPLTRNLFNLGMPSFKLPSATKFRDYLLPREAASVEQKTVAMLKGTSNLTSSFDGLTTPYGGESIYTHHATTMDGDSFLLGAHNRTSESHTGDLLFRLLKEDIKKVGTEKFAAQCSDGAANVKLCRRKTNDEFPWIVSLSDPVTICLHRQVQGLVEMRERKKMMYC
jgi:hypothetical protein